MPRQLKQQLLDAVTRLASARVGVIGDLVADLYVSGQSDRVSREAPVLIVRYEQEWLRPGGAANVAANVAALGAKVCVVGLLGQDEAGQKLLAHFRENGGGNADCSSVLTVRGRDTITKTRFLAGAKLTSRQQVLRVDRQPGGPPPDWVIRALGDAVARVDHQVDAWIVSDYGYGCFDDLLRQQLQAIAGHKPVVADSRYSLHQFNGMTLVKPNEEESEAVARELGLKAREAGELSVAIAERLNAKAALVTLGNQGMVLGSSSRVLKIPAIGTEEIVDLTGAGDSVAATLVTALAAGASIESACHLANHAGAIVVMKEGAATASPAELRASIEKSA